MMQPHIYYTLHVYILVRIFLKSLYHSKIDIIVSVIVFFLGVGNYHVSKLKNTTRKVIYAILINFNILKKYYIYKFKPILKTLTNFLLNEIHQFVYEHYVVEIY